MGLDPQQNQADERAFNQPTIDAQVARINRLEPFFPYTVIPFDPEIFGL